MRDRGLHDAVVVLQQERVVLDPLPARAQTGTYPNASQDLIRPASQLWWERIRDNLDAVHSDSTLGSI